MLRSGCSVSVKICSRKSTNRNADDKTHVFQYKMIILSRGSETKTEERSSSGRGKKGTEEGDVAAMVCTGKKVETT